MISATSMDDEKRRWREIDQHVTRLLRAVRRREQFQERIDVATRERDDAIGWLWDRGISAELLGQGGRLTPAAIVKIVQRDGHGKRPQRRENTAYARRAIGGGAVEPSDPTSSQ